MNANRLADSSGILKAAGEDGRDRDWANSGTSMAISTNHGHPPTDTTGRRTEGRGKHNMGQTTPAKALPAVTVIHDQW